MRQGPLARLRALVLLVALGVGLAGQAMASLGMPMTQDDGLGVTVPMGGSSGCPGCGGNDSSLALAPSCGAGFCIAGPAILAQAPAIKPAPHATYPLVAAERVEGITIRPDLGPPRPTFHM